MNTYRKIALRVGAVMRWIFGSVLLLGLLVKLFGFQDTFADGFFDDGMIGAAFKVCLMAEAAYWALRYRMAITPTN